MLPNLLDTYPILQFRKQITEKGGMLTDLLSYAWVLFLLLTLLTEGRIEWWLLMQR